jgi:hypothetical protein
MSKVRYEMLYRWVLEPGLTKPLHVAMQLGLYLHL